MCPTAKSSVEAAGYLMGYVFVISSKASLLAMEQDKTCIDVEVEDKGWCRWRVSHERTRDDV